MLQIGLQYFGGRGSGGGKRTGGGGKSATVTAEQKTVNGAKKVFNKYKSEDIVWTKNKLNTMKKDLREEGFESFMITSDGYGFEPKMYAFNSRSRSKATVVVEFGTYKNDNKHYIKVER